MRRRPRSCSSLLILAACVAIALGEDWPQFRGALRDNVSRETGLLRDWPEGGPRVLWSLDVCEGYAGAAIHTGRVYLNDYDREKDAWLVRCLSLTDGSELWRYAEEKRIRPNHGITRTVPAVDGKYVFALDPKCVFHCLDAATGKELWQKHLVRDYQAQIPPWYNGQCPLIEDHRVILGIGGPDVLMAAFDKASGNEIWRTPNEQKWPLSHSSVMPAELCGVKQYLWCTLFGPLGVRASDGRLLWHHDRKFNVAVAPSPLGLPGDRVFMTSGYDAGSIMLRLKNGGETIATEVVFDWDETGWNSEVHTPILHAGHMFAVGREKRGLFTCLDLDGKVIWNSQGQSSFELGSFLLADGLFFILEGKTGMLRLLEADTEAYRELDHAQVLKGPDVWGPMALSDGKLVLRDMAKLICLQVAAPASTQFDHQQDYLRTCAWQETSRRRSYRKAGVIDLSGEFELTVRGIWIDTGGQIYVAGDCKVAVYDAEGKRLRQWSTDQRGFCAATGPDGRIYVGEEGQLEIFDADGRQVAVWHDKERMGLVTSIAVTRDAVIVADVADRRVHRYDRAGNWQRELGTDNRRRFLVPNRYLDFALDPDEILHVANSGMHRVQRFTLDDERRGYFGEFHGTDPAGFPGCCNPTNLALTPDGLVVTSEKAPARVKVYNAAGELLAVVATDEFDQNCKNMDLAVDARGRIHVLDTVQRRIVVFEPVATTSQPARGAEVRS